MKEKSVSDEKKQRQKPHEKRQGRKDRQKGKRDYSEKPIQPKRSSHQGRGKVKIIQEPHRKVPFSDVGFGREFTINSQTPLNAERFIKYSHTQALDGQVRVDIADVHAFCIEYLPVEVRA